MKYTDRKTIHEKFHSQTRIQLGIIKKDNFTYRKLLPLIDSYIETNKRVLDVGCGSGTVSFYLANKGNTVVGIDISKKAIKKCSESAEAIQLQKKLSFQVMDFPGNVPDGKFDAVVCTEVIEHLPDDDLALRSLFTLLKKGGTVIVSTPSKNAPLYKVGYATHFDKRVGHLRRYTMDELRDKAKSAGFTIVKEIKTEGVLRNFLFLNSHTGVLLRLIRYKIADAVTFIDDLSCRLFGESDLILVLKK